jgi:hypothetical protein
MKMLRFKEFLNEGEQVHIDIDPEFALTQVDKINEDLEAVTAKSFVNSALFINAVRGTLERYGIVLPAYSNMQQLSLEGETTYTLNNTEYSVYMVWNLDEDHGVEGYATLANEEELADLASLNDDDEDDVEESPPTPRHRLPPAARDDDSGNTNEYA